MAGDALIGGMAGLGSDERAAVAQARSDQSRMLEQVESWSAINSGSGNATGLAQMADRLGDAFSLLPGAVRRIEPAMEPASTTQAAGANLHLSVRPDAPVRVLLTGHMDTVFPVDHPFQRPEWLDATTLRGPGVADMKGGLAVMLAALTALEASPVASGLGYEVVINSDEEIGSPGSMPLLLDCARRVQAGFTFEPAQADGLLAGARRGSGNFAFQVAGRAAHAGRNPEEGRNAVVAAADLAVMLAGLAAEGLSVNPARIAGGGPNNVVPDHAVLHVNFRAVTANDQARAEVAIAAAIARVERTHDVRIIPAGRFGRPPKPMDANQRRLFEFVGRCGDDLAIPIAWRDTGGVCDGNNLAAAGLPVVDTMGVRGGAIHSADEFLLVDSLGERAALTALALVRLAVDGLPAEGFRR